MQKVIIAIDTVNIVSVKLAMLHVLHKYREALPTCTRETRHAIFVLLR